MSKSRSAREPTVVTAIARAIHEATIVNNIVKALRARRVYVVKIHGGPFQRAGLPDLWCVWQGRLVCLEVKRPGEQPTPRQVPEINELREHGATAVVVTNVDEALEAFPFQTEGT